MLFGDEIFKAILHRWTISELELLSSVAVEGPKNEHILFGQFDSISFI